MLKLKFQYFGHLMRRMDSLEKTLIWERLKAGGEGDDKGWDGWMASPTRWTWVRASPGTWRWTGKPGALQSQRVTGILVSQRVRQDWATELKEADNPWPSRAWRLIGKKDGVQTAITRAIVVHSEKQCAMWMAPNPFLWKKDSFLQKISAKLIS